MIRIVLLCGIFLLNLIFFSCASKNISGEQSSVQEKVQQTQTMQKAAWEIKWEKLVDAAKKEGRLIIYSGVGEESRTVLGEMFRAKFGINIEWVGGQGPELSTKIMMERRGGLRAVDVLIGASQPALITLKPTGALDPLEPELILPKIIDPKAWFLGQFPWLDRDHYIMSFLAYPDTGYIYNKDFVKPQELSSFRDLLDPKWKGKIVMFDPTFPGAGAALFIATNKIMGSDYMRELAKQEPLLTRDRRVQIEWIARGKYLVGVAPHTPFILEFQKAGVPIEIGRPAEGSYVSSGIGILSLLNEAPHPNAARVFANWLLTRETQAAHSRATQMQSFRDDIPVDYLEPPRRRDPNMKYFVLVTEEYLLNYNDYLAKSQEIFRLLKN